MKTKPISTYCKQEVDGWNCLPASMVLAALGDEEFCCGFLRESDGAHMMASVKDLGAIKVIHVSIAPIRFYKKDWSDEEHQRHLFANTPEIVASFFGNRPFARKPDDPRRPEVKHYFAILEANE